MKASFNVGRLEEKPFQKSLKAVLNRNLNLGSQPEKFNLCNHFHLKSIANPQIESQSHSYSMELSTAISINLH
jgi:hypothetical protein